MPDAFPVALHLKTMMLVIDASVAVKFVVREPGTDEANALVSSSHVLIAPDWMLVEVIEALRKKVKANELIEADAKAGINVLKQLFERFDPAIELMSEMQSLAFQLQHPAYDCLYLALALREGAQMITADRKFWNAAKRADLGQHIQLLERPSLNQ